MKLERSKINLPRDARKLKIAYLKVINGDENSGKKAIQELSFVQSGLITQLTGLGKSLHEVIEFLTKQGNSEPAVREFVKYYTLLRSLLNDIHSGTRRARKRDVETGRDKIKSFGVEISNKKESKLELKETKSFENLLKLVMENIEIIINYSGSSKYNNAIANKSFEVVRGKLGELMGHAEKLSDLLIDMGFDLKKEFKKYPEKHSENLKFFNKAEKRSYKRAA